MYRRLGVLNEKEQTSLQSRLEITKDAEIAANRHNIIIKCMADTILLCGKLHLALCGHRDDSTSDPECNRGNFLALLDCSEILLWKDI